MSGDSKCSEIDRLLGANVSALRLRRTMTRNQLAERVGVSDRTLQEYEAGVSRISASKLYEIAKALDAEVSELFTGLDFGRNGLATNNIDPINWPAEREKDANESVGELPANDK